MNTTNETRYITITREEYDNLAKAGNYLMTLLNTPPIYLEPIVAAIKKSLFGSTIERSLVQFDPNTTNRD